MSRNEWEHGDVKLSGKEFTAVRRDMIAFHNANQTRFFEKSQAVYTRLKTAGKGKRGYDFHSAFQLAMSGASDEALRVNDAATYNRQMSYREAHDVEGYEEIQDALFPYERTEHFTGRSQKPKAPRKNAFKMLKQNAEGIPVGHEAGIGFNRKTRTVRWSTGENNHAVERAHDHPTGREFFKRLSRVVWTRGTSGEFIGNDEYNEDSGRNYAGGGGSYVTHRFGVAEKAFKKSLGVR